MAYLHGVMKVGERERDRERGSMYNAPVERGSMSMYNAPISLSFYRRDFITQCQCGTKNDVHRVV